MTQKSKKTYNLAILNLAKKTFFKKYPQSKNNITNIKQIHSGYTNYSFLFILKNGSKFQVRIPNDANLVNRTCEYQIIKLLKDKNFVFYDVKTGIAIKKWIDGSNPTMTQAKSLLFLHKLFKQIQSIHKLPKKHFSKFKRINFSFYNENVDKLPSDIKRKYLEIFNKYKNAQVVINHSDINLANIVVSNKHKIYLIDFEWVILAPDYWDYANFFREHLLPFKYSKLLKKYIKNFDFNKFCEYVFLTTCFAYLWSFKMPLTKKMIKYQHLQLLKIKKYFKFLVR